MLTEENAANAQEDSPESSTRAPVLKAAALAGLPPRTVVLDRELELARRQLDGYTLAIRSEGRVVGEEIVPPAEGSYREDLLDEISRLERHLANISTPVVMPDLVLNQPTESAADYPWNGPRPDPAAAVGHEFQLPINN